MVFGKFGDMMGMIKQAKMLKDEMGKARYEAEAGGVRVVVNGEMEVIELKISIETNLNKIESLVKEAVNRAMKSAKADMAQKMSKMTGGLQLPGM